MILIEFSDSTDCIGCEFNNSENINLNDKMYKLREQNKLLQKENGFTEIAFLSHMVIPTAPSRLSETGENNIGTINKFCVSHNIGEKVGLGYNVGYNYLNNRQGDFTYSLVLGMELNDKISTYIEPYGEFSDLDNTESNFNIGITYLLRDNLQLDYSYGLGLNHAFNFMSVGFSININ